MAEEVKNSSMPPNARSIAKPGLELLCADFPELAPGVKDLLDHLELAPGQGGLMPKQPTDDSLRTTTDEQRSSPGDARMNAGPSAPEPVVPQRIGKYAVTALIGEGGQSLVYRAVHPSLASEVVIKVCRKAAPGDANAPAALAAEGRVLAELNHPHIARVFDLDVHEGRPFLVMEYVRGRNLKQYAADAPLGARRAAQIVAQAARGVGAAHRAGVVHLDIKPHNIVVDDSEQVKVIDFGIARRRGAMYDETWEQMVGTPMYFAPEQAQGRADLLDSRTDVFALGCVLFYLLSGKHAYGQAPPTELMTALSTGTYDRNLLGQGSIPGKLRAICLKAMSADRADRYADADAMAVELERFLRPAPRWWLMLAGAALLFAAFVPLAWKALHPSSQLPAPPHVESANAAAGLPIRTEVLRADGWVSLASAGPLLDGDKIRIESDIPAGLYASLLLLDPQGNLTELSRLAADAPTRALRYPGEGEAVPLTAPSGTEVLMVLTRRGEPLDLPWLKEHWPAPGRWPVLAPGSIVFLGGDEAKVLADGRGLGAPVAAGDPADEIRLRLTGLRRALDQQVQDVRAIAFSHAAKSR